MFADDLSGGGSGVGREEQGLYCLWSCESEQEPAPPGLLLFLFSQLWGVVGVFFFCCLSYTGERNPAA